MLDDLLDHPLIGDRHFFPRRSRPRARLDVAAGDATLACALHRADPDGLTVVHFHGDGEVVADWQEGFDEFVEVSHAERLAAWAGGPVTLGVFEDGDHNSILAANEEAYLEAVGSSLARARLGR